MKSAKILLSVVALGVSAFVSTGMAQEKKGRGQMSTEQRITRLEEALGSWTVAQKPKATAT